MKKNDCYVDILPALEDMLNRLKELDCDTGDKEFKMSSKTAKELVKQCKEKDKQIQVLEKALELACIGGLQGLSCRTCNYDDYTGCRSDMHCVIGQANFFIEQAKNDLKVESDE